MIIINETKHTRTAPITRKHRNWIDDLYHGEKLSFKSEKHRRSQPPERLEPSQEIRAESVENITSRLYWLTSSNPKTIKSLQLGYLTAVMHLAPANYAGFTTCKHFSECATTCLYHQGRGKFPQVKDARIKKTRRLVKYPEDSIQEIAAEICYLTQRLSGPNKPKLAIRLNCLSDIPWESVTFSTLGNKTIFDAFPNVQFYDYTKWRFKERPAWQDMPLNYHLTYSFDGRESDIENCLEILENGHNVQMILTRPHYKTWIRNAEECHSYEEFIYHDSWKDKHGNPYRCVDGDDHDLRFLDSSPVVLMGREKGYSNIAV